jgi:hypothetical protein
MREYAEEGLRHFYFMMLQKDEVCEIVAFTTNGALHNSSILTRPRKAELDVS